MGQGKSKQRKQREQRKPLPVNFIDLMEQVANDAQIRDATTTDTFWATELPEASVRDDIDFCVGRLIQTMANEADHGRKCFHVIICSPLFSAVWQKLVSRSLPLHFVRQRLEQHVKSIQKEFAKRTGLKAGKSIESLTMHPFDRVCVFQLCDERDEFGSFDVTVRY